MLKTEGWRTEEIREFIGETLTARNNVLIILNTKKAVRDLYDQFKYADFMLCI